MVALYRNHTGADNHVLLVDRSDYRNTLALTFYSGGKVTLLLQGNNLRIRCNPL